MVFLDALIVEHGNCVFDELPADYVALFDELAAASSDNTMLIPWEIWPGQFHKIIGLGAKVANAQSGQRSTILRVNITGMPCDTSLHRFERSPHSKR